MLGAEQRALVSFERCKNHSPVLEIEWHPLGPTCVSTSSPILATSYATRAAKGIRNEEWGFGGGGKYVDVDREPDIDSGH